MSAATEESLSGCINPPRMRSPDSFRRTEVRNLVTSSDKPFFFFLPFFFASLNVKAMLRNETVLSMLMINFCFSGLWWNLCTSWMSSSAASRPTERSSSQRTSAFATSTSSPTALGCVDRCVMWSDQLSCS